MRALVGIDIADENTAAILTEAARFAGKMGATLDVGYIDALPFDEWLIRDASLRAMLEKQAEKFKRESSDKLNVLVDSLPEDVRGIGITRYNGGPAELLCELGSDYDVIMIGTHGRTGLSHLLIGSVAERIVRRATVPVLVLRIPEST